MAFNPQNPPTRPGDYTRFTPARENQLPASSGSIVLVPFTDEWGPLKEFTELTSWGQYLEIFGRPAEGAALSEGYVAVYNAFKGKNSSEAGAGTVLAYRMGGADVAKASSVVAPSGPALTFTAKYSGTRGNQITYSFVVNASNPTTHVDLLIYSNGVKVEEYFGYSAAQITALAAAINRDSKHITSSAGTNGVLPTVVAGQALTGGHNGGTLLAADWIAFMNAAEARRFGHLAPANVTDGAISASLTTWAKNLNVIPRGKRFSLWLGGLAAETYSTAVAAAVSYNDENIVRVGVGTYRDTALDMELSTAQLAPRLAGVQATYGGTRTMGFTYLEDLEIVSGPSNSEIESSLLSGLLVLTLGVNGVRVERGVTTYSTKTAPDKPFDTYSSIKYTATMQNFEREGREENEDGTFLGAVNNNEDTREALIAREQKRLNKYIARGEVQPGARVVLSAGVEPSDDDTFAAIDWLGKFARGLEQVRRTVIFS